MTINEMIKTYLDYTSKTKSKGTYNYETILSKHLLDYFKNYKDNTLTRATINDLILYYKDNTKLSNVTINKSIKYLRQVLEHFDIRPDAIYRMKLLPEQHKHFDLISIEQQSIIKNYLDSLPETNNNPQYKLIMLYDLGLRQNELLNIKLQHIDIHQKSIKVVNTKTHYDRVVYYNSNVQRQLIEHLNMHKNNFKVSRRSLLFYNDNKERPFNKNDLKMLYRRIKNATGIKKLHSHMFRHTLATELVELDVPLLAVQKQLGHRSLKTTEIYLHVSTKFQQQEIKKVWRTAL